MYTMPGEVLQGEKPGVFGLSLYRVFAGLGGAMVGQLLFGNNLLALGICVGVGVLLSRRGKGLYLAQELYYRLVWMVNLKTNAEALVLDPARLYRREMARPTGALLIRQPDGTMITVQR